MEDMIMEIYQLTRRQVREGLLIFFYEYYIHMDIARKNKKNLNITFFINNNTTDLNTILIEKFNSKKTINISDDELFIKVVSQLSNITKYQDMVDQYLESGWSFDRLSIIDKAILAIASIEITSNPKEKGIIINEAIELAKQYSEDDAYKFINRVLDQV